MSRLTGSLYDYPAYYELVFGSDWRAEYDFLRACFAEYAGRRVKRVFEPACGTGRLLFRLGRDGYRVSGLDLNPRAVEYCNARLVRHGLPASVFVGDMADFRLPQPLDAAFNTINSFRHLPSEKLARAHLACMARALAPGGIYVLGLHLTPTRVEPLDEESWSARRGHVAAVTHLETIERDARRRIERCRMQLDVYTPTRSLRLVEELRFRTYTAPQFRRLLAAAPELELAAVHDFAYRLDKTTPLDGAAEDVVAILRKR